MAERQGIDRDEMRRKRIVDEDVEIDAPQSLICCVTASVGAVRNWTDTVNVVSTSAVRYRSTIIKSGALHFERWASVKESTELQLMAKKVNVRAARPRALFMADLERERSQNLRMQRIRTTVSNFEAYGQC